MSDTEFIASLFDEPTASFLLNQPWIDDGTPETFSLVSTLRTAEGTFSGLGYPYGTGAFSQFVTSLTDISWYADGLDKREKLILKAVFETMNFGLSPRSDLKHPDSDWIVRMHDTLKNELYTWVSLPQSGDKPLIAASKDPDLARRALTLAATYMPDIEAFFGPFKQDYLFFFVTDDSPNCGQTRGSEAFILLQPDCVFPLVVAHETVHTFTEAPLPGWYSEGIAEFVSARLTADIDVVYRYLTSYLAREGKSKFHLDNLLEAVDDQERFGGMLFLKDVADLIGYTALSEVCQETNKMAERLGMNLLLRGHGTEIFDVIRSQTPADKKQALEDLIAARTLP